MDRILILTSVAGLALGMSACGTTPSIGSSGARTVASGSAGGANSSGANEQLERCNESMGTLTVVEDQNAGWYHSLRSQNLQSTVPVIRMLIQQSNCFVVVERGQAMRNMRQERALEDSGEMRAGSNFGRGQMVAADYTLSPSVTFSQKGTGGLGGLVGGRYGGVAAGVLGSMKFNDASTMLLMTDNRSGVQLGAAEGSSRNMDFGGFAGGFPGFLVGVGGYSNTPEGKLIVAAFFDAYNQMVRSVRNYQAQTVRGGLGTGGRLGVQGGTTPASQDIDSAPARPRRK